MSWFWGLAQLSCLGAYLIMHRWHWVKMGHCRISFSHSQLERSQVEGKHLGCRWPLPGQRICGGIRSLYRFVLSRFQGWVGKEFSLAWNIKQYLYVMTCLLYIIASTFVHKCCICTSLCSLRSPNLWKCEISLLSDNDMYKIVLCQDIPETVPALSSTRIWKGLCVLLHAPQPIDFFPIIKCTVYLIFHSISKPLNLRG